MDNSISQQYQKYFQFVWFFWKHITLVICPYTPIRMIIMINSNQTSWNSMGFRRLTAEFPWFLSDSIIRLPSLYYNIDFSSTITNFKNHKILIILKRMVISIIIIVIHHNMNLVERAKTVFMFCSNTNIMIVNFSLLSELVQAL